ncbi:MAG: DnaJ C-terminal domain-containing protein [Pseudomonadales bacterium]
MEFKDYYQILGLTDTASQDEVKRSYRKLARKYHPDVSKEADAEAQFKEVSEAYEALKDEDKRAAYDQLRKYGYHQGEEFRPPPGWHSQGAHQHEFRAEDMAGFSDFFQSIFGEAFAGASAGSGSQFYRQQDIKGGDRNAQISITLEEAFQGGKKRVQFQSPELDGQRVVMRERTLDISIPAGVGDGQQLRLKGLGEAGSGGSAGDLYLEVNIKPHRHYVLDGKDINLTLPVTPWEAALGASIATPTLAGKVKLNIPKGSQAGKKLRLKGRGMPGTPAGDQYVILQIVNPSTLDDTSRALYEQLSKQCAFDPRAGMRL